MYVQIFKTNIRFNVPMIKKKIGIKFLKIYLIDSIVYIFKIHKKCKITDTLITVSMAFLYST